MCRSISAIILFTHMNDMHPLSAFLTNLLVSTFSAATKYLSEKRKLFRSNTVEEKAVEFLSLSS